jgi:CubicO group peptidase (beta-lactamase class C family)
VRDLQLQVQGAIDELVASGADDGLQVAVVHEGRVVVDAVAGVADANAAKPVEPGTLFFAASTGKGVEASVAHVLVDRGDLGSTSASLTHGRSLARTVRTA